MTSIRAPKAVTFDCWSTLIQDVSWDAVLQARCDAIVSIASRRGVDVSRDKAAELIESSWDEHVTAWREGRIFGASGAAKRVLDLLELHEGPGGDALATELTTALEDATSSVGTLVVEGAPQAVEALRDMGIGTALICDTGFTPSRLVRRFLDGHGFVLDHYVFSDEVGVPKPHPAIFRTALDALGLDPSDVVHIGDLRRTDIAGARAAGMGTIRFTGVHDDGWHPEESSGEEADAVLHRWSELPDVLGLDR